MSETIKILEMFVEERRRADEERHLANEEIKKERNEKERLQREVTELLMMEKDRQIKELMMEKDRQIKELKRQLAEKNSVPEGKRQKVELV